MKPRRPLQVLLVDDSALARELVGAVLSRAGMQVAVAGDGEVALDKIRRERPDVIVLDLLLPNLDGLGFLQRSRGARPPPVVVCSNMGPESETAKRALQAGASAIVAKPRLGASGALERKSADALLAAVRKAAKRRGDSIVPAPLREAPPPRTSAPLPVRGQAPALIAIGASTGGTDALRTVLAEIPFDAPPIVVVQHMTERFVASFAQRLAIACGADVREAQHGELLGARSVRIAPGNRHLRVGRTGRGLHLELVDSAQVSGHRPSVDVLFGSVAEAVGRGSIGVIMTGMGSDGAEGLLSMKRAGARTIAQDRATSVVFGMPGAAIARGAVDQVLPLSRIAGALFGMPQPAGRLAAT
jgi:two-component system chemotaxis response regulator CheB